MKVGIAGRVVAGPKGSAANITLADPDRGDEAVRRHRSALFRAFQDPRLVSPAPTFGANYNQVFDQVTMTAGPQDRNLIVYVGFDEGPKRLIGAFGVRSGGLTRSPPRLCFEVGASSRSGRRGPRGAAMTMRPPGESGPFHRSGAEGATAPETLRRTGPDGRRRSGKQLASISRPAHRRK